MNVGLRVEECFSAKAPIPYIPKVSVYLGEQIDLGAEGVDGAVGPGSNYRGLEIGVEGQIGVKAAARVYDGPGVKGRLDRALEARDRWQRRPTEVVAVGLI